MCMSNRGIPYFAQQHSRRNTVLFFGFFNICFLQDSLFWVLSTNSCSTVAEDETLCALTVRSCCCLVGASPSVVVRPAQRRTKEHNQRSHVQHRDLHAHQCTTFSLTKLSLVPFDVLIGLASLVNSITNLQMSMACSDSSAYDERRFFCCATTCIIFNHITNVIAGTLTAKTGHHTRKLLWTVCI